MSVMERARVLAGRRTSSEFRIGTSLKTAKRHAFPTTQSANEDARTSVKEAKPKEVCQAAQAGNPNRNPQTETPNRNPQPNTIRNWGSPLGRNGWFKVARRDADFVVLSF